MVTITKETAYGQIVAFKQETEEVQLNIMERQPRKLVKDLVVVLTLLKEEFVTVCRFKELSLYQRRTVITGIENNNLD